MRYSRQPDKYSCGPIAILNAMKWAGIDASTHSHLPFLQFGCRTIDLEHPNDFDLNGTTNADFDRVLRYVAKGSFKVRRKKHPTLGEIRRHLAAGGAVALAYHWEEDGQSGEHFCFLPELKRGLVVTVNDHSSPVTDTVRLRTSATIKTWIKRFKEDPYAWFLTQEI